MIVNHFTWEMLKYATENYTYLGSIITTYNVANQVKEIIKDKQRHVRKYQSFISKNRDAPYTVKLTVLQGAVNSAILNLQLRNMVHTYLHDTALTCWKKLLNLRNQTCSELVYLETDS